MLNADVYFTFNYNNFYVNACNNGDMTTMENNT